MVAHAPVWPVRSGNSIRRSTIAHSLGRHGPVTLLQIPLGPSGPPASEEAPVPVRVRPVGARRRSPRALATDLVVDRLPTELVGYSWRDVARELAREVAVEDFDLVWACRAVGFLATRDLPLPVVCDLDDLEDVKLERLARISPPRGLEQARLRWRVSAWRRLQERCLSQSAAVTVCTDDDAERLARRSPARPGAAVVPNCLPGVGAAALPPPADPPELLLLGLHTYGPNADAAAWFVGSVLPRVRAAHPRVVVRIVGEAGDRVRRLAGEGVVVTGEVDDTAEAFARASALVVSLRYGSGSRLKIVESWARGVPVVTTTIGAEGLGATDGVDASVADDAEGLAAACSRLLSDPGHRAALADGGRSRYEHGHTQSALDRSVDAVLERALGGRGGARLGA